MSCSIFRFFVKYVWYFQCFTQSISKKAIILAITYLCVHFILDTYSILQEMQLFIFGPKHGTKIGWLQLLSVLLDIIDITANLINLTNNIDPKDHKGAIPLFPKIMADHLILSQSESRGGRCCQPNYYWFAFFQLLCLFRCLFGTLE